METKEFEKLVKTTDLKKIIRMHYSLKINLTSKQLDKVLNLKKQEKNKMWKNKN